jgi:nicotinamide-nucleotide amidase
MNSQAISAIKTACLLAIGTELSTGQITNTNASWLSQQLTDLGIQQCFHLTVADDHTSILKALQQAEPFCDLLIVTGGLGPTADDFTRHVIAEWLGVSLSLDQASLETLTQRAARHELKLSPAQQQQCYFPEQAHVITNPAGTANAFYCTYQEKPVFVLPGPPSEIQAIWTDSLEKHLQTLLPGTPAQHLFIWQCMGLPEAEIGEKVEAILAGSGLTTGYRVHSPYVEVKVWSPELAPHWLASLEQALAPWIMARNQEDLAALLLEKVQAFAQIEIIDNATAGLLQQRLHPFLRQQSPPLPVRLSTHYDSTPDTPLRPHDTQALLLSLQHLATGEYQISASFSNQTHHINLDPPATRTCQTYHQRWIVEQALRYWSLWLTL